MFIWILEFFWKKNNDLDKDLINNEDILVQIKNISKMIMIKLKNVN